MSPILPPPGGGAIGVVARSGLMSLMNLATFACAGDSLGVMSASISVFGGMPRAARLMLAHSGEFTHQLIISTTCSGYFVRLDADHSIDALYQAFRSVALPVTRGKRSTFISPPDALLSASTWLDHCICM